MKENCLPKKESELSPRSRIVKFCFCGIGISSAIFMLSYIGIIVYSSWADKWLVDIVKEHTQATVGLPLAAITSFFLVSMLQVTSGNIEFEGIGFKFRGASGPVVLWIACFIAMVIGIRLLW